MSKPRLELLNKEQMSVFQRLADVKDGVLGGGTALMLQIAKRKSYDLDVFLPKAVSKQLFYKIKKEFEKIELLINTGDELSFVVLPEKVKVSLFYYPFKPLFKLLPTPFLKIFSWKDIALDKAYTIGRRGAWRDYVDLFFILKQGLSLNTITKGAEKKFKDAFSGKLFLSQLTYFKDISDFSIDFISSKHSVGEIQAFLQKETAQYIKHEKI